MIDRTPTDQATRDRIAAELSRNTMVIAGAGSGKTTALTETDGAMRRFRTRGGRPDGGHHVYQQGGYGDAGPVPRPPERSGRRDVGT